MPVQLNLFAEPAALESVVVFLPKPTIEAILTRWGRHVHVIGSRITEDGYELVLEGDAAEMSEVLYLFNLTAL